MMFRKDGELQSRLCLMRRNKMKKAIVIEPNDIKSILAEKYGVPESNVIKSQYSYTVVLGDMDEEEKED